MVKWMVYFGLSLHFLRQFSKSCTKNMYYFTKPVIFIFPTVTALEKHILLSNLYSFLLDRTEWIRYLFNKKSAVRLSPTRFAGLSRRGGLT